MWIDNNDESSRPVTPSEEDCCHSACEPCIFDTHKKLLEEYERNKKKRIKALKKQNILCTYLYKNFAIVDIKEISEYYSLLYLKYQGNETKEDKKILIDPGQHVMFHVDNITKPYTPISYTNDTIEFLIKFYPDGKFSTYLKNTKIGNIIRVRGPYGNFKYEENSVGSGIAAVYPIAKSIVDNELEETKIHLIAGFQNIKIPLKTELQNLSDYWNFKTTLYISQLQDIWNPHGINVKSGKLDKNSVFETLKNKIASNTLILICGTHEFNVSVEQWIREMNYMHIHIFE